MNKKQRIKRGRSDKVLTAAVLFLLVYGTLMIASAEMGSKAGVISATGMVLFKQLVYVILGLIAMKFCSSRDFLSLRRNIGTSTLPFQKYNNQYANNSQSTGVFLCPNLSSVIILCCMCCMCCMYLV